MRPNLDFIELTTLFVSFSKGCYTVGGLFACSAFAWGIFMPSNRKADGIVWVPAMDGIFDRLVITPVKNHAQSDHDSGIFMGYDGESLSKIIESGLTDFNKAHHILTTQELVLGYCFLNMQRHYFSAEENFLHYGKRLTSHFTPETKPILIDIGCGPATAALAFASAFPDQAFKYIGVDRASSMRNKGCEFFDAGVEHGLIAATSKAVFRKQWDDIGPRIPVGAVVILNFSFFFGNPLITNDQLRALVALYNEIAARTPHVYISYTNSPAKLAKEKYIKFVTLLDVTYSDQEPFSKSIKFFRRPFHQRPNKLPIEFEFEMYQVVEK